VKYINEICSSFLGRIEDRRRNPTKDKSEVSVIIQSTFELGRPGSFRDATATAAKNALVSTFCSYRSGWRLFIILPQNISCSYPNL